MFKDCTGLQQRCLPAALRKGFGRLGLLPGQCRLWRWYGPPTSLRASYRNAEVSWHSAKYQEKHKMLSPCDIELPSTSSRLLAEVIYEVNAVLQWLGGLEIQVHSLIHQLLLAALLLSFLIQVFLLEVLALQDLSIAKAAGASGWKIWKRCFCFLRITS